MLVNSIVRHIKVYIVCSGLNRLPEPGRLFLPPKRTPPSPRSVRKLSAAPGF
ncbi:hypothetical protein BX600DRAFT_452382 [Xylariales sp. PMI_506]|nr:hypothetical protein BX600DRAFT_452382 [Xylariales sp. PMI_506]